MKTNWYPCSRYQRTTTSAGLSPSEFSVCAWVLPRNQRGAGCCAPTGVSAPSVSNRVARMDARDMRPPGDLPLRGLRFGVLIDLRRGARAHQVPVAVGVVHAPDGRPELVRARPGRREGRLLAA